MARAPKRTPGPGHNSGLPAHADIHTATAMEMIFEAKEKELREQKKRARSRLVEGKGLLQDDMKFLKSLRDKTGGEVIDLFTRQWHLVGAMFPEKHEQLDLWAEKKSPAPVRAAYYAQGLVAGLQGKDFEPPPMVTGDDRQQMLNGHNEGRAKYQLALEGVAASLNGDGNVVDGTGKGPAEAPASGAATKVAEQAAADFAKDQGDDPLVVNGERYPTIRQANAARKRLEAQEPAAQEPGGDDKPLWDGFPEDNAAWSDEQKAAFAGWFLNASDGVVLDADDFEHPGAAAEVRRLQKPDPEPAAVQAGYLADPGPVVGDEVAPPQPAPPAEPPKRSVARPDFHAWDDDWEKWTAPQCMEFRRWFESLPAGTIPAITHTGAVDYFNLLREEVANRADAGPDDDFEMSEQERAAQALRPSTQEAEPDMDPATLDAKAKELANSGFVPPKRAPRRRTTA